VIPPASAPVAGAAVELLMRESGSVIWRETRGCKTGWNGRKRRCRSAWTRSSSTGHSSPLRGACTAVGLLLVRRKGTRGPASADSTSAGSVGSCLRGDSKGALL
jgi:hypothetical protein